MTGKIFVNYRREDAREAAGRLRDRLAQSEVFGHANVFMDVDDLLPGQRFDAELGKALAQTAVLLAVIGPRWQAALNERTASSERDYVREEIAVALKRGIIVIPVLIDGTPLPRASDLPEDIRELLLHQKHAILFESFGRDTRALIEAIRTVSRKGNTRPLGKSASAALFVALAAAAFVVWQRIGHGASPELQEVAQIQPVATPAVTAVPSSREGVQQAPPRGQSPFGSDRAPVKLSPAELIYVRGVKEPRPNESFRECKDCPDMVIVPPGEFLMGSSLAEVEALTKIYGKEYEDSLHQETPQHKVKINAPLGVGKTHVTKGQFSAFVKAKHYNTDGGCNALNGYNFRKLYTSLTQLIL